jgi:transcriptional regulator with XRE-family HTH domain
LGWSQRDLAERAHISPSTVKVSLSGAIEGDDPVFRARFVRGD